ncbi:ribonuclease P protein subunit p30 isoform X2 [Syngnathus scovelli]|uniref:ribonuclease P protein subunit p30 isoform X2 n=1 Tax=Syngnathus scovelli TaxID=161590 RepID=UPI00210FBF37|nr:ribonuclease P protein subunit p30 isoform X2 [Syngnathus scovelli]
MPRPSPHNNFISHKAFRRFGPHAAPSIVVSIMSVFMDLNLTFSAEKGTMQQLIDTAAHLGFSTVAVNYMFEPTGKKKEAIPSPKPIEELIDQLPIVQGRSRPIRVLNRLTLVMSELSHWRPNPTEYADFDLLAVQPTTEKLFHAACTQLEVDVISVVVTEKLPFFFKRAPVNVAVERGVAFEVSYAAAIRDATMRRYTIANAVNLAQACRGKNVLVTSAATKPLELRGPYDIINLCSLLGLSDDDAKRSVSCICRSLLLHAETRKTASGVISTKKSCGDSAGDSGKDDADEGRAPAAKRLKSQLTD